MPEILWEILDEGIKRLTEVGFIDTSDEKPNQTATFCRRTYRMPHLSK